MPRSHSTAARSRLLRWQIITIVTLLIGYTGFYFCRSYYAVIMPLLLHDYDVLGLDKFYLGWIATIGTLAYAVGKIVTGGISDMLGGRFMFVFGMCASALATVFFGFGMGFTIMAVAWGINRLAQSPAWGALSKMTSAWFSYRSYGRVMAVLSMSYLLGDTLARYVLGSLIEQGMDWRSVTFIAAAILSVLAWVCWFWLKPSAAETVGIEREVHPRNLFGEEGKELHAKNLWQLIKPYFGSLTFWLTAYLSMGLTLMREAVNQWSVTYLVETTKVLPAEAAKYSAMLPLIGAVSALAMGFASDTIIKHKRGLMIAVSQALLCIVFVLISGLEVGSSLLVTLVLLGLAAFFTVGPYSFLAGAIALELGGRIGVATGVGLIDGAGYIGALAAGVGVGKLAQDYGWSPVFWILAGAAAVTALIGVGFWYRHERKLHHTPFS